MPFQGGVLVALRESVDLRTGDFVTETEGDGFLRRRVLFITLSVEGDGESTADGGKDPFSTINLAASFTLNIGLPLVELSWGLSTTRDEFHALTGGPASVGLRPLRLADFTGTAVPPARGNLADTVV